MKHNGWAVGATILHVLLGALLLGTSCYLLLLTKNADVATAVDSAAVVLAVPSILILIAAFGLWKQKLWGWWTAFIFDLAWSSVLVYGMIDDGWKNIDIEVVALFAISLVPTLFLVLPSVRKSFWRGLATVHDAASGN